MWRAADMVFLFLVDKFIRSINICTHFAEIIYKVFFPVFYHAGKWPQHIYSVLQKLLPIYCSYLLHSSVTDVHANGLTRQW